MIAGNAKPCTTHPRHAPSPLVWCLFQLTAAPTSTVITLDGEPGGFALTFFISGLASLPRYGSIRYSALLWRRTQGL